MNPKRQIIVTGALACLLSCNPAVAGNSVFQSLESIRQAAERFVRQQIQLSENETLHVQVRQLDRRLRLPACPEPLQVRLPDGFQLRSRTSVQVQCTAGEASWKLYVPLQLQREVATWVARTTLPRGHTLGRDDLQRKTIRLALESSVPRLNDLLGKRLRQAVSANQPLHARLLEQPVAVRRGQRVDLVAGAGRVRVRMRGEVLQDARLGEKVRVRNLSSKKVVEGWLTGPDRVLVGGPPPQAYQVPVP